MRDELVAGVQRCALANLIQVPEIPPVGRDLVELDETTLTERGAEDVPGTHIGDVVAVRVARVLGRGQVQHRRGIRSPDVCALLNIAQRTPASARILDLSLLRPDT